MRSHVALVPLLSLGLIACPGDDGDAGDEVASVSETSSASSSNTGEAESGSGSDSGSTDASSTDASSTDATGTDETTSDPTSTDSSSTTGDTTTGGTCVPIEPLVPVEHPGFTGSGMCEGVHQNVALLDQAAVDAHAGDYCTSLGMCFNPGPPCQQAPTLEQDSMIVYAFGEGSGCSFTMDIAAVEDCGDAIVVTGDFTQIGPCGAIGYAWAAVAIPTSDLPVEFVIQ